MIEIIKKCEEISSKLDSILKEDGVVDYRIYLRTNERLYVYLKFSNKQKPEQEVVSAIKSIFEKAIIETIPLDEDEEFYKNIFSNSSKVVYENGRRRLNSLFLKERSPSNAAPIVTFYSYKGGMGRTTALASFATYLALKKDLNVFIIDCDIEAPGFNNFFLKYPGEQNQQQGLVEYLIDKEVGLVDKSKINKYCFEVSHDYSNRGTIRVMHAGNLNTTEKSDKIKYRDINHYIEGLSRLDLGNTEFSTKLFEDLFSDIRESYAPDVILIDSKTGLSDVMGLTVCSLSDIVVGFFRNDAQSWPGLFFFIQTMMGKRLVEPFIVNSILPSSISYRKQLFSKFKDDVTSIISEIDESSEYDFPCFGIYRYEDLELIGTSAEHVEDFVDFIKSDDFKPYKELFEALSERIIQKKSKPKGESAIINQNIATQTKTDQKYTPIPNSELGKMDQQAKSNTVSACKKYILERIYKAIESINLYADNLSIADEIEKNRFFFRQCMNDLFNQDKYMILGSKGTGKSYLYSTLRSPQGVSYLQKKTGREGHFVFVYTIDKKDKIFCVDKFGNDLSPIEKYRFWIIYTWNSIVFDIKKNFPDFTISNNVDQFRIKDDDTTFNLFKQLIKDENYTRSIETEMKHLDDYLSSKNSTILSIVYDQLDEIVNPSIWDSWIPNLITIWRGKGFANISGKLFVRTDLFRTLVGLSNKNDIENKAINIAWSKEEIYSYFFKIVLSNPDVQTAIWNYMYLVGINNSHIKQCRRDYEKRDQFRLDDYILSTLVSVFFGEYVDTLQTTKMGTSYDWFYKNLKNADDTISLRPFIDLLKNAFELQSKGLYKDEESIYPILYQKYYTNREVRIKAVERHYEDLVSNTIGNKPIDYIFDFIRNTKSVKYKRISIHKKNFEEMLSLVLQEYASYPEMSNMTVEQLKNLLQSNGIVCKVNFGRGDDYVFSFLYKYTLGLHGI